MLAIGVLECGALYHETIASLEKKLSTLQVPIPIPQSESGHAAPSETTHDLALFLQFEDERTIPKEIRQTNVPFWRALYSPSMSVKDNKGVPLFALPPHWFVVLWFEKSAIYRQMFVKCIGSDSLKCAVHESNDRFAIITVAGDVSRATLEVSVKQ